MKSTVVVAVLVLLISWMNVSCTRESAERQANAHPKKQPDNLPDLVSETDIRRLQSAEAPLVIPFNLDLIAPLGEGSRNAAEFFAGFTKATGDRLDELRNPENEQESVEVEHLGTLDVFPLDSPLLREAGEWVDQGVCRFYPDFLAWNSLDSMIPNLLVIGRFGNSWIARGLSKDDYGSSVVDIRRAIRLGRLLLQDDVALIQNLFGTILISRGARALYALARENGDCEAATMASMAALSADLYALILRDRMHAMNRMISHVTDDYALKISPAEFDLLDTYARSAASQALRMHAAGNLFLLMHLADNPGRERARSILEHLSVDPNSSVANYASHLMEENSQKAREQLKNFVSGAW